VRYKMPTTEASTLQVVVLFFFESQGVGRGLCLMVSFGISAVETSGSAAGVIFFMLIFFALGSTSYFFLLPHFVGHNVP
jgi:hypothetical protein